MNTAHRIVEISFQHVHNC